MLPRDRSDRGEDAHAATELEADRLLLSLGLTLRELASDGFAESARRSEVSAVGPAGTVYLCHPFLVHAAQPHRGTTPRFLAQPPLLPRGPLVLDRGADPRSPVEEAIARALAQSG